MRKEKVKSLFWEWFILCAGSLLVAVAMELFLAPNKIVNGGISGISTMLYHVTNIPIGTSYFVINLLLLIIAYKVIGLAFIVRTLAVVAMISIGSNLFSGLPAFTENIFLAMLFGGLLYGAGMALLFYKNATSGGTDIIGRLIQHFLPNAPIGKLLILLDGTITLMSLIAFGEIDLCLWGFIALAICNGMIDISINRLNVSTVLIIVTEYGEEMARLFVSSSPRGCTVLDAKGAYTDKDRTVLLCAAKEKEIAAYEKRIESIDPNAFVIFTEAKKVAGRGFSVYR